MFRTRIAILILIMVLTSTFTQAEVTPTFSAIAKEKILATRLKGAAVVIGSVPVAQPTAKKGAALQVASMPVK